MVISKPIIEFKNGNVFYIVEVQKNTLESKILWFKVSDLYQDFVCDSSDAALLALLIPAMAMGEDITVEGWVSEKLFHNLSYPYQKILKIVIPSLKFIKIHVNELKSVDYHAQGVATGFSAGVDSFCTLQDYYFGDIPASLKITHLTFHNVGSHNIGATGYTEQAKNLFQQRYNQLKDIVQKLGDLPFIMVDSNLDDFYDYPGLYFMQTHTPRNMSVALLLQKGLKTFLYSSAIAYEDIRVKQTYNIDICDPITLPLMSTESIDLLAVGSEYSRVEKTLHISDIAESYHSLDVCVDSKDGKNCSICFKCMRTQLTLDIANKLHLYDNVFDSEKFNQHKQNYLKRILQSNSPLDKEIVEYALTQNYPIPLLALYYGKMIRSLKLFKQFIKKAAK